MKPKKNDNNDIESMPPFLAAQAIYRDRLRLAKTFCVVVLVIAAFIVGIQEYRFQGALNKALNQNYLVIPGTVDFMRVRPGFVPDSVIYSFVEYIAENVGSFSYVNIESRAERVSNFCSASFREKYNLQLRRELPQYKELRVTEIFNLKPVDKFELKKDKEGNPFYIAHVYGQLDRFSNDQKLVTENHVITIKFRTSPIKTDKPWFFEVTDINRQSLADFLQEAEAQSRLTKMEK